MITIKDLDGNVLKEFEVETLSWANLYGANLSKANLSCANLTGANLSGAYLSGANLSKADLSWANLSCANLYGADLSSAKLSWANLSCADLSGANLSCADLYGSNLSCANLSRANLSWTDLSDADLSGANLSWADLYGATINWSSHALVAELLFRHAGDDIDKRKIAGLVLISKSLCWNAFITMRDPLTDWALDCLSQYVTDGDSAPEFLMQRKCLTTHENNRTDTASHTEPNGQCATS